MRGCTVEQSIASGTPPAATTAWNAICHGKEFRRSSSSVELYVTAIVGDCNSRNDAAPGSSANNTG